MEGLANGGVIQAIAPRCFVVVFCGRKACLQNVYYPQTMMPPSLLEGHTRQKPVSLCL